MEDDKKKERASNRRKDDDRRALLRDRRVTDPAKAKRVDELGMPLPDRRGVFDERRTGEGDRRNEDRRVIPVVPERKVHSCVYVEGYRFYECVIKTCKNFTDVTKTKCLAIDRVQPVGNKIISDAELHLYKFTDTRVSTRLVSIKRKKAVTRVKAILILNSLIEFIRENYKPGEKAYSGKMVEKLELDYPLRIRKLQFYNWMWPYLTSKKVYKKFVTKKGGECSTFKVHMLLNLTRMKYETLIKQLKEDPNASPSTSSSTSEAVDRSRPRSLTKLFGVGAEQLESKG